MQTFFKSTGLQKRCTVLYDEEEDTDRQANETEATLLVRAAEETTTTFKTPYTDVFAITADRKKQDEKLNEKFLVL